jgi:hypothetical protein
MIVASKGSAGGVGKGNTFLGRFFMQKTHVTVAGNAAAFLRTLSAVLIQLLTAFGDDPLPFVGFLAR